MKTFDTHSTASLRALLIHGAPRLLTLVLGLSLALASQGAGLAVIVNPESGVSELTKAEVIHLFMGRQKRLPSGATALTVDLGGQQADKADFYAKLVNKDLAEINSYWARLIFSGQGSPPVQAESVADVLEIVQNNKGAIGYVEASKVGAGVKIVFTLP